MACAVNRLWYGKSAWTPLLLPLSWLYCAVVWLRRKSYAWGLRRVHRLPVPVIVVGNLTVGGTGKTPLVAWLAARMRESGFRPGIVSRGYGGRARNWPQQVRPDSDPVAVGDEAVLLARHCACPVAVGPDRAAAARALLEHHDCDLLISDDGLQHYALGRDIEILVIDGVRRFGNGHCLPAGPLREPRGRVNAVDVVVTNGLAAPSELAMKLMGADARSLSDAQTVRPLRDFAGRPVHAVAGIGHPERFFEHLGRYGLEIRPHAFADHHPYAADELEFGDDAPVLMTEKDAVKCQRFARPHHWYVPVEAEPDARLGERVLALLQERKHG